MQIDKKLLGLLLIGLILRLILSVEANINSSYPDALHDGDSFSYTIIGKALANSDFLITSQPAKDISGFRTPGYPAFIGVFYALGLSDGIISIIQVIIDAATIIIIYQLALVIFKNNDTAFYSALLYAISPLFISFSYKILSESLFIFVFLLANLYFFKYFYSRENKHLIYSAILFSILIMIRPVSLGLPIIYSFFLYLNSLNFMNEPKKFDLKIIFIFLILSYLSSFIWVSRNVVVLDEFSFSSIGAISSICWTGPVLVTDKNVDTAKWKNEIDEFGLTFPDLCAAKVNKSNIQRANKVYEEIRNSNIGPYIVAQIKSAVLLFAPQTPNYVLDSLAIPTPHLAYVVFKDGINVQSLWKEISGNVLYIAIFAVFIFYYIGLYGLLVFYFIKNAKNLNSIAALMLLLIVYLLIVHGPQLIFSGYRYRIPIEPFIILLAGNAICSILKSGKGK